MGTAHLHQPCTAVAKSGRQKEAHNLLAPVYDSFTEGFTTKDLKEAKTLLSELR